MNDETKVWLQYAEENFESAKVLLDSKLFNPCLQNIQQAIEKSLKAILIERSIRLKKTHSILELKQIIEERNLFIVELSEDDCDFLDSIYLPSKYPLMSVLPDFEPNENICDKGIMLADKVLAQIKNILV